MVLWILSSSFRSRLCKVIPGIQKVLDKIKQCEVGNLSRWIQNYRFSRSSRSYLKQKRCVLYCIVWKLYNFEVRWISLIKSVVLNSSNLHISVLWNFNFFCHNYPCLFKVSFSITLSSIKPRQVCTKSTKILRILPKVR